MTKIKLYSPPIITAKGKIKLGHGANLVWCDILARIFSKEGISSDYAFPAWNHQGKMFDDLAGTDWLEETLNKIESSLESKINLFGLSKYTPYRDTSKESRENTRDKFGILIDKGFITPDNGSYFLRIDKISTETDLVSHIYNTNFFPIGAKERMLDLVKTLNGAYPISKPREFATPIPEKESSCQKINPIFDLAVSPLLFSKDPIDYSIDSLKTMLHGTFIPFVIWSGLYNLPFSKNVAIHGYLIEDSFLTKQSLEEFYQKTNQDIVRGSALLCTGTMEDTYLNETRLKKIIKGTSKLVKLAWFFKNFQYPKISFSKYNLKNELLNMNHSLIMNKLLEDISCFSHKLEQGKLNKENYSEYVSLLENSKIFFPNTYEKSTNILKKGIQYLNYILK